MTEVLVLLVAGLLAACVGLALELEPYVDGAGILVICFVVGLVVQLVATVLRGDQWRRPGPLRLKTAWRGEELRVADHMVGIGNILENFK